ncbi:unnamed protein product [marine sediment metagenome]|uniref:Uncharacterized protein n=1 Tax=marine sediment metagenome TaxID=412755 RepID=X1S300_9ZZZZ
MILAWPIDRYNWCLSTSLEIAKRRFMIQAIKHEIIERERTLLGESAHY